MSRSPSGSQIISFICKKGIVKLTRESRFIRFYSSSDFFWSENPPKGSATYSCEFATHVIPFSKPELEQLLSVPDCLTSWLSYQSTNDQIMGGIDLFAVNK